VARRSLDPGFEEQFDELSLPMALVDLDEMRIIAITPEVRSMGGLGAADLVGRPVLDVIAPADHQRAGLALAALAGGGVDFYRAEARLGSAHEYELYTSWAAAIEVAGARVALVQLGPAASLGASPLERFFGPEPLPLTIGEIDRNWVVTTVSSSVERLLGVPAADVVGRVLLGAVERRDVSRVLRAAAKADAEVSVGLSIRVRGRGGWRDVRVVLGSLSGLAGRFFVMAPESAAPDLRATKLEQHLRRIAAEVQASGILEVAPGVPALARLADHEGLTPRQWDVLTRLLRGERVRTIAKELFVSESTVRNHLSAIYARLGVGSQAELMAAATGSEPSS
jgi:DNA-binding CsgD family transcriptional regulator/PAS domain-containing protein